MSARQIAPVLQDLHLLTLVAEARSFTRAARQLGISKSSVSMRIKGLEQAVGVPLVHRTTRSVALTPAGLQLAEHVHASFAHIEHAFTAARDLVTEPAGVVRVSAPVALGRQWISPAIPALMRRYPKLRLDLDLSDRLVNLTQDGYDLAVRHSNEAPGSCVATLLCESRSHLLASPAYLRRRGVPRHPQELAEHACLLYLRDAVTPATWWFKRGAERVGVQVSGPFRANNSEVLREAIAGGLGVGLLPGFSALAHAPRRDLVPVLPDWGPSGFFGDRIYAIRPWAPRPPRAVECVIRHLRECLGVIRGARL